jgi:hypothetical protein
MVRLGGFAKKEELNACKETILKSGLFKADQIREIPPPKLKKK